MTDPAVEQFLAIFYGPGNELSPEALAKTSPELSSWLDEHLARLLATPTETNVLPRRVAGKTRWYGLAHSSRQLRDLAQALDAFIVPTYARLDRRAALDTEDPVEAAVLGFTSGHALVMEVIGGQQQQVRTALELLTTLNQKRPRRELVLSRPLGRLLREFEMSVLAGSEGLSSDLLREIDQSGQLSAQNLVFLRIRRLSGLRRFDDLLQLPELAPLLAIRRPARVSASLLEAVYNTELAGFEAEADPAGAISHFSEVVLQKYPALFRSRHGLQTPAAIKTFMLHSIVLHPDDGATSAQLLAAPDLRSEERQYLQAIVKLGKPSARRTLTLTDAGDAARNGDFDQALAIARDQPTSVERAEILIRCAVEIDSMDAMSIAATAVGDLPADGRTRIIASRWYATPWEEIERRLTGGTGASTTVLPSSWPEWFQLVVSDAPFDEAPHVAERAVVEWAAEDLTGDDGRKVAGLLLNQDLSQRARRLIKESLPNFLQFLDRSQEIARHRDLLDDISTLLFLEEELGVADVQVLVGVVGTLLELGMAADRCRQIVDDFTALWARIDSPAQLDNAIELFDMLLTFGADPSARDSLLQLVVGAVQRWRRRVRSDQWTLLEDLATEVGAGEAVRALQPDVEVDGKQSVALRKDALAGKTVAIYTLTEPAGTRARDFVLRNFDDVAVELSHDHVASDRLRALARAADLFVVATRSAKHAATTFIEAQRPAGRPVLFAGGKGSASLIRTVLANVIL